MSHTKELVALQQEQWITAEEIAVEAGALAKCELHEEVYDPQGGDMESAYRLGNYRFSRGKLSMFSDRREMTDTIKAVVEDAAMECYLCAKWRDED